MTLVHFFSMSAQETQHVESVKNSLRYFLEARAYQGPFYATMRKCVELFWWETTNRYGIGGGDYTIVWQSRNVYDSVAITLIKNQLVQLLKQAHTQITDQSRDYVPFTNICRNIEDWFGVSILPPNNTNPHNTPAAPANATPQTTELAALRADVRVLQAQVSAFTDLLPIIDEWKTTIPALRATCTTFYRDQVENQKKFTAMDTKIQQCKDFISANSDNVGPAPKSLQEQINELTANLNSLTAVVRQLGQKPKKNGPLGLWAEHPAELGRMSDRQACMRAVMRRIEDLQT
jgi:hypothetical protein